jgi:hypothetical protein
MSARPAVDLAFLPARVLPLAESDLTLALGPCGLRYAKAVVVDVGFVVAAQSVWLRLLPSAVGLRTKEKCVAEAPPVLP